MTDESRIAETFWGIYSREWQTARQSLSGSKHEEEIIYLLMTIVRSGYEFCIDSVKDNSRRHSKEEIVKDYIHNHLQKALHMDHIPKPVTEFTKRIIRCLLKMVSRDDPLSISWIPKGDVVDSTSFNFVDSKKGHVCDWTVWPAVLGPDGQVLCKGVIIPV